MNTQRLFRRSRIQLAAWYAIVMGAILSLSGWAMYRALVQSNWLALEREIESIAGTLHDSVEPLLPDAAEPTVVLPCAPNSTLIQRHTIGISDRKTYYIRLFNAQGQLLAFSANQPLNLPPTLNPTLWQTHQAANGTRYRQFSIVLHSAEANHHTGQIADHHSSWGYFQVGRTLAAFDAETQQIQWIMAIGFPITLGLIGLSSWGLAGLAMRPIYQSYQQQAQFIANAAHELQSPLAGLLATIEALIRLSDQAEERQTMQQTIVRQGQRLSHLIADLLWLTRVEQKTLSQSFQPCNLNDLVSGLTEEFLELAVASQVELTSAIPAQAIIVLGDTAQLERAVANLIANAIHYTPPQGQVSIRLAQSDHRIQLTVQDNGMGIAAAEQDRIFERFYRVQADRDRKTGGTGLGLAIVQAIVRCHGGSITVSSKVGSGSAFTIHLPAMRPYEN
jgi:two-component system, OmpR family, Ni(II)-sensor and/or redox sensor kinase NrsS